MPQVMEPLHGADCLNIVMYCPAMFLIFIEAVNITEQNSI
jgi:hypothetical protein